MSDEPIHPTSNNLTPERPERYRSSQSRSSGGASGFITGILLIIALIGVGLLAWLTWQQSSQLEQASQRINTLMQQVSVLEQELEVTESTLTESDTDVAQSVKLWESETRKLWDLYNDRIKNDIASLRGNVTQVQGQLTTIQDGIDEIQTNIILTTRNQQDLTDKVNLMDQQTARKVSDMVLQVQSAKETIDAIDRSRSSNNNRILELERKVRNLSSGG
ncbi:MAG: hypothetical protein OXC80_02855 [Gammaproteobacteria bacterium]|nr:hypothetical protein [Gammaproteobacteria bacterium]